MSRIDDREPIIDDENPEWTEEDFATAQSADELPIEFLEAFPNTLKAMRQRRVAITLNVGQDLITYYKSRSDDWQAEMEAVLRKSIER